MVSTVYVSLGQVRSG